MGILEVLALGRDVIAELPKLLYRGVKQKQALLGAALEAGLGEVPRSLLTLHLGRLEAVEDDLQCIEGLIAEQKKPYEAQIDLLVTIPGISNLTACVLIAELGVDMSIWLTHCHLAVWGGVAPGCRETGGKARKAPARKGNPFVCSALVEAAGAAVGQDTRLPFRGQVSPPLRPYRQQDEGPGHDCP
jgi:transposase